MGAAGRPARARRRLRRVRLIDEVVDDYLTLVERLEDRADELEDTIFATDDGPADVGAVQERLFRLKRECVRLRRAVMPLRQGIDLLQEQPALAAPALAPYYRDVIDHVIRTVELVDNIRDLLTSMLEVRVAQVANHLNEVMKKLTAWAGIILVPTLDRRDLRHELREHARAPMAGRLSARPGRDGGVRDGPLRDVQAPGMALRCAGP